MKGKKFAEVFASLVKTVAIASVSESSDWYNYQTKEPEGLIKPAFFASNFMFLYMLFSVIVLYNKKVLHMHLHISKSKNAESFYICKGKE